MTMLAARHDPARFERYAMRWLCRLTAERDRSRDPIRTGQALSKLLPAE
jgi:hypothetical protein